MSALAIMSPEDRLHVLFEICGSKEELRQHMLAFLGIDFPDQIVDEDSTSTPLEFVWAVYNVMRTGEGPTSHVVAAARGTTKTLSASVVRFYGMIHFRRDGTHLAATEDQSKSANLYLDRFLKNPDIQPFVVTSNSKTRELRSLPANGYTKKDWVLLRVAVATVSGVNSQRGSLNTRDEVDLVPASILSEATFIAEPTQDEHQFEPIELNLSSRKSNYGPIQNLLDDAENGRNPEIQAHKWSLVDWMQRCPDDVHLPDQPRVKAWVNTENLKLTWDQPNFDALTPSEQTLQKEVLAYEGCRTCPAFAVCQARSPKQIGKQKNLRTRRFVAKQIFDVRDSDKIIAQALNWKPESSAVIFRAFNRRRHFLHPIAAWQWLFGAMFNPRKMERAELLQIIKTGQPWQLAAITPTKADFYMALVEAGWKVHYGVDWGYNPDPAVCVVVFYHKKQKRGFLLHTEKALNHSNQDWADHIKRAIYPIYPAELVAPDTADKASPTYFRKTSKVEGTDIVLPSIPSLDKKPARIETGVSQLRGLLWNVAEQIEKFAILDDGDMGENQWVAECFEKWTWLKNAMGFVFGKFDTDSEFTHPLDALRYALDPFIDTHELKVSVGQPRTQEQIITEAARGDEAAKAELVAQQNAPVAGREALQAFFGSEFGLKNIFAAEDRLKAEEARKSGPAVAAEPSGPTPKKTGLKFKF